MRQHGRQLALEAGIVERLVIERRRRQVVDNLALVYAEVVDMPVRLNASRP
jgi:hypothetical protein